MQYDSVFKVKRAGLKDGFVNNQKRQVQTAEEFQWGTGND